jgi:hypothetical protein
LAWYGEFVPEPDISPDMALGRRPASVLDADLAAWAARWLRRLPL